MGRLSGLPGAVSSHSEDGDEMHTQVRATSFEEVTFTLGLEG